MPAEQFKKLFYSILMSIEFQAKIKIATAGLNGDPCCGFSDVCVAEICTEQFGIS